MSTAVKARTPTIGIRGQDLTVRPIRHDDVYLEEQFIENLSFEAKHNRFLGGIRTLSKKEMQRLCDVDYHDSMAFVATVENTGTETEVGVARYAKDNTTLSHELAITIADEFRNSELGKVLVETLIEYAREHGIKTLYSMDLSSNYDMRKLADELGMSVRLDPDDSHQVIYSLNVDAHPERVVI